MIEVSNLTIGYGTPLVEGISFRAEDGECILLCGANGCGKTTLLRTLASTSSGTRMIPTRIPKVKGFTLREFVCLSREGASSRAIDDSIALLGLTDLSARDISTLSDGEFQKATIAAAIASGARNILLDEPTAFLDVKGRVDVLNALRGLCHDSGLTVIFSSHDIADASRLADRVFAIFPDRSFRTSENNENSRTDLLHGCFDIDL